MTAAMRREFFRLEKLMNEVLGPSLK